MKFEQSQALFERAQKVIPGGVNSPVRAFRAVGGTPPFIERARGANVVDADGNTYIDYVGSWGPMILGHADPAVVEAARAAAGKGSSYGAPTEAEIKLAELVVARVESVERVRLVSSGTEATMSAIRVARGATGRDAIVKFEGCYHGHADYLLSKAGSGVATFGLPDSPGVPADFAKHTLTCPFNNIEALSAIFEDRGQQIAAVIVEPVAGNMGCIPPAPGFLEGLRSITEEHDALLIFDEVMTGFRVHAGGAQTLFGIKPDLSCFGKVIGGGYPLAAYGGDASIMERVAPAGPVYQAGTLSGNPVAVAAGIETLEHLEAPGTYDVLEKKGAQLEEKWRAALEASPHSGVIQRCGTMMTLFFNDGTPVRNFADAQAADHERFRRFFHGMLERGIYLPPSGYEALFISLAHTDDDLDRTAEAASEVLATIR